MAAPVQESVPRCPILCERFYTLQHPKAEQKVCQVEFFGKGDRTQEIVKGKRWLLPSHWAKLDLQKTNKPNCPLLED
jgi:hypothetical protein